MAKKPARSSRLYQNLAEHLTRQIASGVYGPGDRLPAERELAATFEVSRPTVREAIIALELDGLVDVRTGSGVYVTAEKDRKSKPVAHDIGAIELTEARMLIEGEVAATAATQITDEEVAELRGLLDAMAAGNAKDARAGERVDAQFHAAIARATHNSALVHAVDQLWTIRNRSPQCVRFFDRSRDKGNTPDIPEHTAIVDALEARDPVAARAAMRDHLSRVLRALLDATEFDAIEEARARVAAQRNRFAAVSSR